jgi:4'-phosphopantetheinyl transferase
MERRAASPLPAGAWDAATWPDLAPDSDLPAAGAVRCWRVMVDAADPATPEERVARLLTPTERDRALRLQPPHRRHAIFGRAALRLLLGAALRRPAATLELVTEAAGKPVLADGAAAFNVSHSGGAVVIAIARRPIGIDVEATRRVGDRQGLAARFFHPEEARELAGLADPAGAAAFLRCWTRKEAVVKALGTGIGEPLDAFRVTVLPQETPRILDWIGDAAAPQRWTLHDIDPAPGHFGTLAAPWPAAPRRATFDLAAALRH